ncbi:MAG: hypothetical protein Q9159_006099 [Coniocarpon cinnabarinum]
MPPLDNVEAVQRLRASPHLRQNGGKSYQDCLSNIKHELNLLKSDRLAELVQDGALESLDVYLDTIPYLYLLHEHVRRLLQGAKYWPQELKTGATTWNCITAFLKQCHWIEIRQCGRMWRYLVEILMKSAEDAYSEGNQSLAFSHVTDALLHLDPSGSVLTSLHCDLLHLASARQCTRDVLPLLDKEISNIPTKAGVHIEGFHWSDEDCPSAVFISIEGGFSDQLGLENIQEYFILGSLAYIGARNWRRAIFLLEHVLTTPVSGVANGLMVEAYDKWILLNLIQHGSSPGQPRTVPQSVMKHIRSTSKPYEALRDAYVKENGAKLLAEVIEGDEIWKRDGNAGLVQRVLADHKRRSVTKLGSIFAAVPLQTVSERLSIPQSHVQSYLARLVAEGAIDARLEQTPSGLEVLRFVQLSYDKTVAETEGSLRDQLIERTLRLKKLADAVNDADQQLSMSRAYLDHVRKARRSKAQQSSAAEDDDGTMDIAPGAMGSDEDEELMADAP